MKLETFQYNTNQEWSVQNFPDMDSEQTFVLVFASPEFIHKPKIIQEIAQRYPKSKILGCSSAGEIMGTQISDNSVSVAIAKLEKTPLKLVKAEINVPEDSFQAGKKIATLLNQNDLSGIFVLSDGLNVNGTELAKGLNTLGRNDIIITGGLAGDGERFQQTWSILNGNIQENAVVALGFYGDHIQIGHASRGGWDIFGPERLITRSKNNILFELDGRPALALYKEYLGERAKDLPASGLLFPLAIRQNTQDARQLVRTILAVNEIEQSLTFAGDVPTGYLARLMRANFDRLIASANEAGESATQKMFSTKKLEPGQEVLAVAISCVGRRLLLGGRTEEETESMLEALPKGTKQVGFYSYGELSPFTTGDCDLHNQTMTLTTFSER